MENTAPVKIIDGRQYDQIGYYVAIGPRQLLADAHANHTPVEVTTGDAQGDHVHLLTRRPWDRSDETPFGLVKHWTAERGPYTGQEIAVYLVDTERLDQAPILAKHITKRTAENLRAHLAMEARVAAEEAELSRPAD